MLDKRTDEQAAGKVTEGSKAKWTAFINELHQLHMVHVHIVLYSCTYSCMRSHVLLTNVCEKLVTTQEESIVQEPAGAHALRSARRSIF